MNYKNLCVREDYEKDGEKKHKYNKIGTMFKSGKYWYAKLFMHPDMLISIFDPKPKEEQQQAPSASEDDGMDF